MATLVKIFMFILFSQFLNAYDASGQDITIQIKNIDNNKEYVFVVLYNAKDAFLNESYKGVKSNIKQNSCEVIFKNIPKGVYAISLFHDENENNKMDKNFLNIPMEDYGCSNNAKGFMGPPKWEDAKFEIKNKSITQIITL